MAVLYYRNSEGNLLPISFGGSESYILPVASENTLGGIKSGNDITISSTGKVTVNSVNGKTVKTDVPENAVFTDTLYTLPAASEENLGGVKVDVMINGMSTDDKVPTSKAAYDCIKAYTDLKIADLVGTAPEALNTIEELATAMQENHDVVEALDLAIGQKANKSELTAFETTVNNELYTKVDKDNIPVATAEKVGGVKPDGVTVSVGSDGILSAQKAIDSIYSTYPRPNMYRNTKTMDDPSAWYSSRYNKIKSFSKLNNGFVSITLQGAYNGIFNPGVVLKTGKKYTFSIYAKSNVDEAPMSLLATRFDGSDTDLLTTVNVTTDWKLYIYSFIPTNDYVSLRWEPGDTTSEFSMYGIKLEEGDFATAWAPHPDDYAMVSETQQKSNAKLAIQIAHPNNYLIYDDLDKPSTMVAIPKFYLDEVIDGAEHIVHPAFMVNGIEQNAIYISKYQNIVENDRAYSLPMEDPAVNINFDQAWNYCKNKGTGWHLTTNAEWAAIALWCKKNGTIPKGNNNYGKDISETNLPQKAIAASMGSDGKINRVLTGSGRESWYHDGTYAGIADLNGNVWEWIGDIRLVYGELQVIPYNNAASGEVDVSASSADWKALNANATSWDDLFITPNESGTTANSVKLDWVDNHWQWNTTLSNASDVNRGTLFASTNSANIGTTAKLYLQVMALLPEDGLTVDSYDSDHFYAKNGVDEMCVFRGGVFNYETRTGIFSLEASGGSRVASYPFAGARSAYIETNPQVMSILNMDSLEGADEFQMNDNTFENVTSNTKETI